MFDRVKSAEMINLFYVSTEHASNEITHFTTTNKINTIMAGIEKEIIDSLSLDLRLFPMYSRDRCHPVMRYLFK